jgi:hypothetical protein
VAFRGVSSSSDFSAGFGLRPRDDSCASADSSSPADSFLTAFALETGVGDFFSFGDWSVPGSDSSLANFACGIAVGAFSCVSEALRFFSDLSLDAFAAGLGDFFGLGDDAVCPDSSRLLFSSSSTWAAGRRLPAIAPEASAVASQMRKRTTATERNRAREAINHNEC